MTEYNFNEIEKKWQKVWEDKKPYKTVPELNGKPKCYILDMFPYPSGNGLHMGHPLGYTGTDIYSRYKKLQGFNVLHPMGFDSFGLPAEQHAIRTGNHPAEFTKQNCGIFRDQLKKLGLCYDWDREIASSDADYYKWTQWIFLKIYNSWFDENLQKARPISELPIPPEISQKGAKAIGDYQAEYRLAYVAEAMVNWCPGLGTVLANEEVIDGKSEVGNFDVIRKPMRQWQLRITKYTERLLNDLSEIDWPENIKEQQRNWIGKSFGAEINFKVQDSEDTLIAFTTRPDTLFGVTFFVISPEHPLAEKLTKSENQIAVSSYREAARKMSDLSRTMENREKTGVFTGSFVVNPVNSALVPVYLGDYVLANYGTGAVMGVPAHDTRDFAFAKKYSLPIIALIVPDKAKPETIAAIKSGQQDFTENGLMLDVDFELSKTLKLAGLDNTTAGQKITDWLIENNLGKRVVNYRLRDWLFSRQRFWGEPIPVIHWEDGTISALAEEELPLLLPDVADYKPSESGESPLAKANDWLNVTCPKTGKKGRRETNTMPQWAGSCWYYLRFIDPKNDQAAWDKKKEKDWMPVDLYVGGAEHAVLHLLYARFWHKILFDLGEVSTNEPFKKLFNQGMLLSYAFKDSRGALIPVDEVKEENGQSIHIKTGEKLEKITAKMSKSLRNVVTPDEIIAEYGADTLRMFLMFMAPLEAIKSWDPKAINGVFRFLKKAWSFIAADQEQGCRNFIEAQSENKEILQARHALIKKVTEDIENLRFNTPISALMEFLNLVSDKEVSKETAKVFTILLSVYAPHIGEELWQRLGEQSLVAQASWPKWDESLLVKESATVVIQVQGKKRASLEIPISMNEQDLKNEIVKVLSATSFAVSLDNKFITVYQPGTKIPRLVNVV